MNNKRDTGLTNQERVDMLQEAQQKLYDVIDLIEQAVRGTHREDFTDAYVTSHLKIMASEDHGYLSRDTNLDKMIRWFEGDEYDED